MDLTKRPIPLGEINVLRHGENPWQGANLFVQHYAADPLAIGKFVLHTGDIPSATNLTDLDRALQTLTHIVAALQTKAVSSHRVALAVKHGNCCGAAYDTTGENAIDKMVMGDLQAIMGAVVIANFAIGTKEATTLLSFGSAGTNRLLDAVIAPRFSNNAVELLQRKNGKCRVLSNPALAQLSEENLRTGARCRSVREGYVVQDSDSRVLDLSHPELKIYGFHETVDQYSRELDLLFASAICRTSNSNTVTLVKNGMLIGNGVAQTKRSRAAWLAVELAKENNHLPVDPEDCLVAASDSFFPFKDGVEVLINAGVKAIFATSGSVRDKEVQDTCVNAGVTLYQLPDKESRMFFGH